MSKVGRRTINIPNQTSVTLNGNILTAKGPKGELTKTFLPNVKIIVNDNSITVERLKEDKFTKSYHGTTNSLIQGMVTGVTEGFTKELEIIGVGYNVVASGNVLTFSLGYSHKITMDIPEKLTATIGKPTELKIDGVDKQLVGEFAAQIKRLRKPEPYGGKGIRYKGEHIIRKAGKATSK